MESITFVGRQRFLLIPVHVAPGAMLCLCALTTIAKEKI
jgi:hypothetical protein